MPCTQETFPGFLPVFRTCFLVLDWLIVAGAPAAELAISSEDFYEMGLRCVDLF
jgi:hypothetical protein